MNGTTKIGLDQLSRKAVIYIRQSTVRQVRVNEESTRRQYALQDVLARMGWAPQLIETIDSDLGVSGKYSENREGFRQLVGDVANGCVGAVACIEASRLSRNNGDWARLIDFCALTNTVIIDEDGVYDPVDPNDRLLLGVKGSIAEMELHYIRSRMQGGLINKVMRGELRIKLPIGYTYDPLDRIVFDPDKGIQEAIRKLFRTFEVQGSVYRTVLYFQEHDLQFPARISSGERKGDVEWRPLNTYQTLRVLKSPIYCGRYVYGRSRTVTTPAKRTVIVRPENEWTVDIHDHHPGYISESTFSRNQAALANNAWKKDTGDLPTIPGKGSALLQGIVYCGVCGRRMNTVYQTSNSKCKSPFAFPLYVCDGEAAGGHSRCMQVNGMAIDQKVSEIVRERLSEDAVRNAIEIKSEVDSRWRENEQLLLLELKRAEYDAGMMKKRYLSCDPENALVRVEIEKAYNEALARVVEAEDRLQKETDKHDKESQEEIARKLDDLVSNFSKVWDDPGTDTLHKKKLLRHLVRSVTLTRRGNDNTCRVQILYSGNATDEFVIRCNFFGPYSTSWKVYEFLDEHGTSHTPGELADILNEKGYSRAGGKEWTQNNVSQFMSFHKIKTKRQHYQEKGYITVNEAAEAIGITHTSMYNRIKRGHYDGQYIWATNRMILMDPMVAQERKLRKSGSDCVSQNT